MDAPAKHHLRLWCQETVAFVWRQTAQYDLAGGALSLSLSLSFCISRPLLLYHFFSACLALLPLFFLSSTAFLIAPKYPCTAAELWQGKEKTKKTSTLFCLSDFHGTNWNWKIILSSPTRVIYKYHITPNWCHFDPFLWNWFVLSPVAVATQSKGCVCVLSINHFPRRMLHLMKLSNSLLFVLFCVCVHHLKRTRETNTNKQILIFMHAQCTFIEQCCFS